MRVVLVVDDDKLTRWSLAQVLTRAGYHVRQAGSVAEGITQVRDARPDLAFLDLRLPDGQGGSLLQMLHRLWPQLPVVMMSVDATREALRQLCQLGARAYVEKPCPSALLLALADALLSGEARPEDAAKFA